MGARVLSDNKVIGVRAEPFAKLLGSYNYLRTDREMYFVELSQAALYFRCLTVKKEDIQRRMSALRSAQGVSLEAGWRRRGHGEPGKIFGGQSFPLPRQPPTVFGF
jgi:hypothetical protein